MNFTAYNSLLLIWPAIDFIKIDFSLPIRVAANKLESRAGSLFH